MRRQRPLKRQLVTGCSLEVGGIPRHMGPHGATQKAPEVVRSQKGQGKAWMRACTVVFWERNGEGSVSMVGRFRIGSFEHFHGLWSTGVVTSGLVPRP